jgi:hypothetical protein
VSERQRFFGRAPRRRRTLGVAESRKNCPPHTVVIVMRNPAKVVALARGNILLPARTLLRNFLPVRCELSQLRANIQTNQYVDALAGEIPPAVA